MEQCKITAIANQKGGVGKTVSTLNLGVGLARAGQKVLMVDANPQGSLSISLGIKAPDELDTTITTLMQATAMTGFCPMDMASSTAMRALTSSRRTLSLPLLMSA